MTLLRHFLSIALLPFVVVVLVPRWLLGPHTGETLALPTAPGPSGWSRLAGAVLFLAGLGLFSWCVLLFARVGRGTLAPWDPTRRLVAVGPYRHVRNPMISGVAAMLAGEAWFFRSVRLAGWFALFVLVNHIYFLTVEEPGLARRFGAAYARYRAGVPRWIPRWRAWNDEHPDSGVI
ncbi:MAG TPA: isoprenylcysteine carboxylmethyltransferase family protein [Gemmatimonadales bacterium]